MDASATVLIAGIAYAISISTPPMPSRDDEIKHGIAVIVLLIIASFLSAGTNAFHWGLECSHSTGKQNKK